MKYLQALEKDDFSVIPGATFVKGFMRTYAEFLGLDAGLLVDEYRSRFEPEQEQPVRSVPPRRSLGGAVRPTGTVAVALVAIAVFLVLAWVGWGNRDRTPAEIKSGNAVEPDHHDDVRPHDDVGPPGGGGRGGRDHDHEPRPWRVPARSSSRSRRSGTAAG